MDLDPIDRHQQNQIDDLKERAAHNTAVDALQTRKDEEHDRRINRMILAYAVLFGWLGILTLATGMSVFIQNEVTLTIKPRQQEPLP